MATRSHYTSIPLLFSTAFYALAVVSLDITFIGIEAYPFNVR
jgi:hypothetical protein